MIDNKFSYQELLDKALNSKHGIEIVLDNYGEARNTRRRFYAIREKQRAEGISKYDSLSLILKNQDIWIIRKDTLRLNETVSVIDCRPIALNELPDKILSRGKSR